MTEPRISRPGFPGYGITDDDALLPWSWAAERLTAAHNYWIATVSTERGPHAMPVWGLWREDSFVFSTGLTSRKARNLAADPRIVVHLESGEEVVVIEGAAESAEATVEVVDDYDAKYGVRPDPGGDGWFRVRPRRAYAWRESDYPQSATQFDFA
jgi:hypothetical protein